MILIAERINAGFKDIAGALREKDETPVQEWARRQAGQGADYLDLNIGAVSKEPSDMHWLVEMVQKAVSTPICVDSTRMGVLKAGLEVGDGRPFLINSTTADPEKLEQVVPLAVEHGAGLIGVAMDQRGSPQDVDRRVENAAQIFAMATDAGLTPDQLFLDPVLMPMRFMQEQGPRVLEAISQYAMLSEPPPHISVGLSNISSQTSEKKLIARTFVVMAMTQGLDAAICDVTDNGLLDAIATVDLILNKEIYSDAYLRAYRMKRGAS
ncbi:MAG: dihydropteroate synthase [Candidatus Bipolaricaulota bacterium]